MFLKWKIRIQRTLADVVSYFCVWGGVSDSTEIYRMCTQKQTIQLYNRR